MEAMLDKEKVKGYLVYKDSGVEWLGKIPEHWELTRLGTRFEERRTKVSDKDFAPLSVTKNGILPQLDSAAKTNDGDNRKLVKAGDFVINSRSDRKGSSGIAITDGSVSLINIVMEPKDIHPIFCNYYLKCYNFIEEFYRMGHGIVADLWTTRYDEMKSIMVGIPPLPEQVAIANFLDRKTALIDKAIGIKEKQIELLKERRQILIHRAVTRGLNPNVKLKESGVEWIGEIPEGWEVMKLKMCANKITDGAHISPELKEQIHPFISTVNIDDNGIIDLINCIYTTDSCYKYLCKTGCKPQADDVLFSKDGTIGRTALVIGENDFVIASSLVLIRPDKNIIDPQFFTYLLRSYLIKLQTDGLLSGSALKEYLSRKSKIYL